MFRTLVTNALRPAFLMTTSNKLFNSSTAFKNFGSLHNNAFIRNYFIKAPVKQSCLFPVSNFIQGNSSNLTPILQQQPVRTVTKFSLNKGKRKTVKAVLKRFKRLDWGCWIRTYCGRHKRMWKKSAPLKRRMRQHVFVNATQSWLLDKMVTKFWRRPKYYIDDPYAPYHRRDEFFATKRPTFKV